MTGMSYKIYRSLDTAEARKLIIDCVEEYLTAINASKEIRPFLENYPATSENIHLTVYSYNPDHRHTYDPSIGVVSARDGNVFYRTRDKNNEYRYKSETEEPYEVALAMVRKEAEMRAATP